MEEFEEEKIEYPVGPPKCFDYLNNRHLIEVQSTRPGNKFNPDFLVKVDYFTKYQLEDFLISYSDNYKLDIKNTSIYYFVHQDFELKLETLYFSITNEFDKQFLSDIIKVIEIK